MRVFSSHRRTTQYQLGRPYGSVRRHKFSTSQFSYGSNGFPTLRRRVNSKGNVDRPYFFQVHLMLFHCLFHFRARLFALPWGHYEVSAKRTRRDVYQYHKTHRTSSHRHNGHRPSHFPSPKGGRKRFRSHFGGPTREGRRGGSRRRTYHTTKGTRGGDFFRWGPYRFSS